MRYPRRDNKGKSRITQVKPLQAPTGGWDAVSALAKMPPDRAIVLDNWFPTPSDVRVRRGHEFFAGGMGISTSVETLLPYNAITGSTGAKLFAAAGTVIYNITSGGAASSSVTSLTNARWQWVNFTTSGGHYLIICNGADSIRSFDGTSWATPSITGITSANVININVHKGRLWFVQKDSTTVAYLATAAIAGAATTFELGNYMNKGGYVVAMATWSVDGGSGQDDLAVFITSEGQTIIYQGTDPSSADTWSLIGVFDLGPPIGYRCFTKVAGDLALINVDGVLPISKALHQDRGATPQIAITARINNAMNDAARSYKSHFGWQLCPYARGTMAILNVPVSENTTQYQYVMNTLTGAWCRFTGMNANHWVVWQDNLYFGGNNGAVYKADTGSADGGSSITADGQGAYNYYGSEGVLKRWSLLQPLLTTSTSARPAVGLTTDFKGDVSLGTPAAATISVATFDVSLWDVATFPAESQASTDWTTVYGIGQCASVHFKAITGPDGVGVWGVDKWGQAVWAGDTGDVIVRLNGFHISMQPGQGII